MDIKNLEINADWLYHRVDARKLHKIIKSGGLKARRRLSREDRRGLENGVWNGGHYVSFAKKAEGDDTAYNHYIEGEFAFIYDSNMNAVKTKVKPVGSIFETIAKLPISKRFSRWEEEYQVKDFAPFGNLVGIKIPHGQKFWGIGEDGKTYKKRQLDKILKVLDGFSSNDFDLSIFVFNGIFRKLLVSILLGNSMFGNGKLLFPLNILKFF